MHTAPLPREDRSWAGVRGRPTARWIALAVTVGIATVSSWWGNATLVLLALAAFSDLVRPHRLTGWQARSIPFLVVAVPSAPIPALLVAGGLAAYRSSGAPQNPLLQSAKWAGIEMLALALGAMAARALIAEPSSRAVVAYILVGSLLVALLTLWTWARAQFDLFEMRACIAEFGAYLPLKMMLAAMAGGVVAYSEAGVLLALAPVPLLLAGLHDRDEIRRRERAAMLQALGGILRYAHPYTLAHMRRVAQTADRVGAELRLGARHRARLAEAALLHDIGKVAVDERILEKPTRLDDEERAAVQRHSELGAQIVAASRPGDPIVRWIRSHHERMDGTGYPDRLPASRIPIESRIIAVIDAYDAMTGSKDDPYGRRYQAPIPPSEARLELRRHCGTQFDPQVVAAFERVLEEGPL